MMLYFEGRIDINALLQTVSFFLGGGGVADLMQQEKLVWKMKKGKKAIMY